MDLRSRVIRLAHRHPETRRHLIPLLRQSSGLSCTQHLRGNDRKPYWDAVWDMYVQTYRAIGLTITSPPGLDEFDTWDVCIDAEGHPRAFYLMKATAFGMKGGLRGSDGSSEGKRLTVDSIRRVYLQAGYYSELSHKVLEIALAAGVPVICAAHVPKVIGKQITPLEDGIHYQRNLPNVGMVTKVLVGHPRGIPTTSYRHPECPIHSVASPVTIFPDDLCDLGSHLASIVLV